jgi:OOP family OmpA-OmpF porin
VCEGHADEVGSDDYNLKLSEKRAQMVKNFLAKQPGLTPDSLSVAGFGKTRPVNNSGSEEGRAQNRRVEIRLLLPALLPVVEK